MRRFIFFLGLLFISHVEAKNFKLDIGAGYRQDSFDWELAGPHGGPPVLSHLSWRDLRMFEMTAQLKKITCSNIYFRANGDWGWIHNGKNRDSDFEVEQATGKIVEFSRSDNQAGKGYVWDASGGIGYFFRFECVPGLRLAPLAGYAVNEQHLRMCDGFQTFDLHDPQFTGHHILHLDNKYDVRWKGFWLGSDAYYHFTDQITLSSSLEYHWLCYHAKGHWNLRNDFAGDFIHTGHGYGINGSVGLDYNFLCGWYLGCQFNCSYARVKNGRDRTPVRNVVDTGVLPLHCKGVDTDPQDIAVVTQEEIVTTAEGKIKNVKWHSYSIIFTAGYHF